MTKEAENHAVGKSRSANGADISVISTYRRMKLVRFLPFTVDLRSQFKT